MTLLAFCKQNPILNSSQSLTITEVFNPQLLHWSRSMASNRQFGLFIETPMCKYIQVQEDVEKGACKAFLNKQQLTTINTKFFFSNL